jgi:hypothetical protein
MASGYVFVLSNPLYADFFYVGISSKTPKERAQELYSEGVLYPFEIVTAKTVTAMDTKLVTLHKLLGKFGERPNPDKDFFKIDRDILDHLFDLIDGQPWVPVESTPEAAWNLLQEKVGMILKNENPKLNEFQIGKMRIKIAQILKSNGVVEPTLESVRQAVEIAKAATTTGPAPVTVPV